MSRDFAGRTIVAGATVAYPVRRGSSMWLNKLTVTLAADDYITGYNNEGRRVTVKNLKNCVVIESVNEAASDAEPDATVLLVVHGSVVGQGVTLPILRDSVRVPLQP